MFNTNMNSLRTLEPPANAGAKNFSPKRGWMLTEGLEYFETRYVFTMDKDYGLIPEYVAPLA